MYKPLQHIAKNIRLLRQLNGFAQEYVADSLHMSRTCYCNLENGFKLPDLVTMNNLADFYDVNMVYLISFDITEHMLFLIKREQIPVDAYTFLEKYMQLSSWGKDQIKEELTFLSKNEKQFKKFFNK